jgi:hypothetical protein
MPKRPPKKWFYRTLRAMAKNPAVSDPARLTAWKWYHQLSPEKKRKILSEEEHKNLSGTFSKGVKRMRKRLKKGSKAAKAFMRKLRSMRSGSKKHRSSRKRARRLSGTSWIRRRHVSNVMTKLHKLRRTGKRIARKAHIKPFFFTGRKRSQIILSEGDFMRKSRKHRRSRKHYGFEGRRRSYRRHSRRGRFLGGAGGGMRGATNMIMQGAIGAVGAIGSAFVAGRVPVPAQMKPAVPLALAILLVMFGRRIPMSSALAFGAAMSGVLGFTKQFAPGLPTLAGVDSAPQLDASSRLLLGAPQYYGGAVQEFSGSQMLNPSSI